MKGTRSCQEAMEQDHKDKDPAPAGEWAPVERAKDKVVDKARAEAKAPGRAREKDRVREKHKVEAKEGPMAAGRDKEAETTYNINT